MDIIRLIQETATWIEKVNPDFEKNLFRTPELSPKYYYYDIPLSEQPAVINKVNSYRTELLESAGIELIPVEDLVKYGRIMYFNVNETVVDAFPQSESFCYVDLGDAPPCDTWLATSSQLNALNFFTDGYQLTSDFLITWVPASHYFYANECVEVACVDNFEWPNNEYISQAYAGVKSLFAKPDEITIPETKPDLETRMRKMEMIMQEAEENSRKISAAFKARMKC